MARIWAWRTVYMRDLARQRAGVSAEAD